MNLRLIYLSSRTYAGYAITARSPEPQAYDSAFAVRWLIRTGCRRRPPALDRLGPYLWTDGMKGRRDGLTWACEDVDNDGTHPSKTGMQKVSTLLLEFFKTTWFRGRGPAGPEHVLAPR